jgi:hypothetical protein
MSTATSRNLLPSNLKTRWSIIPPLAAFQAE